MESPTTSASIGVDTYWSTCRAPAPAQHGAEQAVKISGQTMELVDASSIQEQDRKQVVTNFKQALATEYGDYVASLVSAGLAENTQLTPSLVGEIIRKAETQDAVSYAQMARMNGTMAHEKLEEAKGEYQGLQNSVADPEYGKFNLNPFFQKLQQAKEPLDEMKAGVAASDQAVEQAEEELKKVSPDTQKIKAYAEKTKSCLESIAGFFSFFTKAIQEAIACLSSILNPVSVSNPSTFDAASFELLAQQQQAGQHAIPTEDVTGRVSATINPLAQSEQLIDLGEEGRGEELYRARTSQTRPVIGKVKQVVSQAGGAAVMAVGQLTSGMQSRADALASTGKKLGGRLINTGNQVVEQGVTAVTATASDAVEKAQGQMTAVVSSRYQRLGDDDEKGGKHSQNPGVRKVTFTPTVQEPQIGEDEDKSDNPMLTEEALTEARLIYAQQTAAAAVKTVSSTLRTEVDGVLNPMLA